jgi:hypothetical protein
MPHLLIERLRSFPSFNIPDRKEFPLGPVALEVLDVIAGIVFILGSVCFLPAYSKDLMVFLYGCMLYVVGSAIYCVICLVTFAEALKEKGPTSLEAWENALYLLGSWVFFIGTFLYWPSSEHWDTLNSSSACVGCMIHKIIDRTFVGTIHFIVGSVLFALAAFVNALNQRCTSDWSSRMFTATTSLHLCGSLLFAMGSVAFFPNLGCGAQMVSLGAWAFILGSVLFLIAGITSLVRTTWKLDEKEIADLKEDMSTHSA